jgi:hypothetical protein
VNGVPVPLEMQRELGLVTVGDRCSGTLVNRFWVLTADHCVTTDGNAGSASAALPDIRITAEWSNRAVTPTRLVRNWWPAGRDVALILLGGEDLGSANIQLYFVGQVDEGVTLTKYGRGISELAHGTGPANAVPSQADGRYRSARFTPTHSGPITYRLPVNAAGQVGAGGDSGGPDIATGPNGIALGITGVSSSCSVRRVPGMPDQPPWEWVASIRSCDSTAIHEIRDEIVGVIHQGREPCAAPSRTCATTEATSLLLMLK